MKGNYPTESMQRRIVAKGNGRGTEGIYRNERV